jgi:hypothetical protein
MLNEILKGLIPIPGEAGGPPYGQYHSPRRMQPEDMLRYMAEAAQSGEFDHLMEGDITQGSTREEMP